MPLHLFRWDADNDDLRDLGRCSSATGEAYSMANLDDLMYIASYPRAILSVYDPSRPWHFGDGTGDNPRDLGRMDDVSYRPRSTLTGPLGRVWTASVPDYGRWGGPLAWYDPASQQRGSYKDIAGDGSCYTLAWLQSQHCLAVGISIEAGTGAQARLERAGLFLWDYEGERKLWEGYLPETVSGDQPVQAINALHTAADGALIGTARLRGDASGLFRFDPTRLTFTDVVALPELALDLGLQPGPDDSVYGFTLACLYRVTTSTFGFQEVLRDDAGFRTPGPVRSTADGGYEILFARTHRLMAAKLP